MFFIRHGQSAFNVEFNRSGRDPGIRDAPLTARGTAQAQGAARHLAGRGITRIIASPYTRALETAQEISVVLGLPVQAEPLAGERALYTCDIGTPKAALQTRWPLVDFARLEEENWWPKTGETEDGIAGRVQAFMALYDDGPDAAQTLVVSHWYFIFTLSGLDAENAEVVQRDARGAFHKQTF